RQSHVDTLIIAVIFHASEHHILTNRCKYRHRTAITAVDPETGEPLVPPDTVPGSNGSGGEPAAPNGGTAQPGGTVPSNPPDNAQPSTPETSSPTTPEAPDPNAPSAPAEPAPVPEVPEAPQIPEDPGFALIGPDPAA
ncbi:MAG: hypothetical protein HFG07_00505, partial [Oscillibacter sp.]|nr:hypothetical protein [Oscillibacter sp.]